MNLIRRAATTPMTTHGVAADLEEKDGDLTWDGDTGWTLTGGERGDTPKEFIGLTLQGLRKNPVVSGCLNTIRASMTDAPIRTQIPDKNTRSGFDFAPLTHPAQQLIDLPNERDPGIQLLERGVAHYLLGGNAFFHKRRLVNRRVTQLIPIQPDRVISAFVDADNIPIFFRVQQRNGAEQEPILADDIVHIPDVDPLNEVFGMPRILSAALDIMTDNEASDYVSEVLTNHGNPGMVVGVEQQRAKSNLLERAEEKWIEKFGPGRGRGRIAFLPGAHTIREVGFNLRDLEFPDLRRIGREGICASFGVDPMILGLSSASRGGTLGGSEHIEARLKLWTQTIIPLMRRWEAYLNTFLAPEFGFIRYKFDTTEISALKEDRDKAMLRAEKMVVVGTYTPQEIREETGMDPTPDPASKVIVKTLQTVSVAVEDVFEKPVEPAPGATDDGTPPDGESGGDDGGDGDDDAGS